MIGRELGGYQIVEQIGMGGMATVFKAYDAKTERYVAIKILPAQYSKDPTFRARFENEARAIAKLEHLHILPVFAFGEEDGISYMVMRYMDTGTLSDRIRVGKIPLPDIARILRQIGEALDYAHANGILHRDIKPSNVLLDKSGNAYLTDFGIAKMVGGNAALDLTGSGIIGTPFYMSPEQCRGERDLGPASDLYSLGIVLYEMITGSTPFRAETPLAVLQMHLSDPLPPVRSVRPELSENAQSVVNKSMAKKAEDRYPSGKSLAEAFAVALATADTAMNIHPDEQTMVGEQMTSNVRPATRTVANPNQPTATQANGGGGMTTGTQTVIVQGGRSPWVFLIAGIVAIVAILAFVIVVLPASTRDSIFVRVGLVAATETATPTQTATITAIPSATLTPTISATATLTPTITLTPTHTPTATHTNTPTLTPTVTVTPLAGAAFAEGQIGVMLGILDTSETTQRLVREIQGAGIDVLPLNYRVGTAAEAQLAFEAYNGTLLVSGSPTDNGRNVIFWLKPGTDVQCCINDTGIQYALTEYSVGVPTGTDGRYIRSLFEGHIAFARGAYDAAVSAFNRAETFMPPNLPAAQQPIGLYLYRALAQAQQFNYNDAIEDYDLLIGFDPQNARGLNNRGVLHLAVGNTQKSLEDLTAAIQLNPDLAYFYSNRALAYRANNDPASAIDDLNSAIGIERGSDLLYTLRGDALLANGEPERALTDYGRAIDLVPTNPQYYLNRAGAQSYIGLPDAVIADLNKALDIDPTLTDARLSLGRVKLQNGDLVGAEADLNAVLTAQPDNYSANIALAELRLFYQDNPAAALEYVNVALTSSTEDGYAFYLQGTLLNQLGRWQEAVTALDEAVSNSTDYPEALAQRAFAQYRLDGDAAAALSVLDAVLTDNALDFAYNYRGLIKSERGDMTGAIADYDAVLAQNAEFTLANLNRGAAYLAQEEFALAIADFTVVIDREDKVGLLGAYEGRAAAYRALQDIAASDADLAACLAINPDYVPCQPALALEDVDFGDPDALITRITAQITSGDVSPQAFLTRGTAYQINKDYDSAINDFSEAIALDDSDAMAYARRAEAQYYLGNYDDAINDVAAAVLRDPDLAYAYTVRGDVYYDQRDYAGAYDNYNTAVEREGTATQYKNRGVASYQLRNLTEALDDLDTALAIDAEIVEAFYWKALVYYDLFEYEDALDAITTYNAAVPDNSLGLYYQGLFLWETTSYAEAIEFFNQSIALCTLSCEVDYYYRGDSYLVTGDLNSALADFEEATRINSDYAPGFYGLGRTYNQLGQYDDAVDALSTAIDIDDTRPFYYNVRGIAYDALGNTVAALRDYASIFDLRAQNTDTVEILDGRNVASGNLEGAGEQDIFLYEASEGEVVTFSVESKTGASLDTILLVTDPDGAPVAFNDDPADGVSESMVESLTLSAGTYSIAVMGYTDLITGEFSLRVEN